MILRVIKHPVSWRSISTQNVILKIRVKKKIKQGRRTRLPFLFAMPTKRKSKSDKQQIADSATPEIKDDKQLANETPTKPKHFKKTAQDQIEKSYKKIVATLADEAQKGSVRHTKLLFDLGGVQKEVEAIATKRGRGPSLGKLLLKEVESMKQSKSKPPKIDGGSV